MKKVVLILSVFLATASISVAQTKIGLRFAPNIAYSRVNDTKDIDNAYKSDGAGVRFSVGPVFDFLFGKNENYAFSTGLWYTTKQSGVSMVESTGATKTITHSLQYIQLPLSLKLYTNEIATDTKLYFNMGGTIDIKIDEKVKSTSSSSYSAYFPIDAGILLGVGAEMQLGENTAVFGGLSYNRGLLNIIKNSGAFNEGGSARDRYSIKADLISLEVGLKF